MDKAKLSARIQEILGKRPAASAVPSGPASGIPAGDATARPGPIVSFEDESAAFAARCAAAEASSSVLEVLGATELGGTVPCVVVDRNYPRSHQHGRQDVERYLSAVADASCCVPWFLEPAETLFAEPAASRLLFFDLETTGLSGGAGTYAFLVGFGFFDGEGFHTRQFFLRGYGAERALLDEVGRFLCAGEPRLLVTYNGRAFDVPLIETRYQFHRLSSPFADLPHLDMLFPARRLWRRRLAAQGDGRPRPSEGDGPARASQWDGRPRPSNHDSCALTAIERDILDLHREDDVPGWEIPVRYFNYARTGDARGLAAVLEHNRLDLLSLAAVTAVVLDMVRDNGIAPRSRGEWVGLGRLFEYLGRLGEAERCYLSASSNDGPLEGIADRGMRAEALHWLARHRRRTRRFAEAAEAWRDLSEIAGIDVELRREALEALAIHNEHRAKDLEAARTFALQALDFADGRFEPGLHHRLGRLERKLTRDGGRHDAPGQPLRW